MISGAQPALMFALSGVMRSGASRSAYVSGVPFLTLAGAVNHHTLYNGWQVQDRLNETANTATFTIRTAPAPTEGQPVAITLGSINNRDKLFAGVITRVTQGVAADNRRYPLWHCECTDWTWPLNQRLVIGRWRTMSASDIARDIVARFAPAGYSTAGIVNGLPVIDEVSFTDDGVMNALAHLAQRIGGYASCDYNKTIRLFLTDPGQAPGTLTLANHTLKAITRVADLTGLVTRAIVQGGGVNAQAPVPVGGTEIVIDDPAWYSAAGGLAMSGPQRIQYTGVASGGQGSVVGPGVVPVTAPTAKAVSGAGLSLGAYGYVYSYVTAAGESLIGPVAAVTTVAQLQAPASAPAGGYNSTTSGYYQQPAINYVPGAIVEVAGVYSALPTPAPPVNGDPISPMGPSRQWTLTGLYFEAMGVWTCAQITGLTLPASTNPQTRYGFLAMRVLQADGVTWSAWYLGSNMTQVGADDGTQYPSTYNAGLNTSLSTIPTVLGALQRVTISEISAGAAAVTARRLYRTAANGSTYRRVAAIADNTTTTYTDSMSDATWAGQPAAPSSDSSGLTQPTGQVPAGSTTLILAGASMFYTAGGWIKIGANMFVRYAGISGNTLTGIPASGAGAITTSIPYGTLVIGVPYLQGIPATGAGSITLPIAAGDPVDVLVIVNDTDAQAAIAALLGGDGVFESKSTDRRVSEREARSQALALLAQRKAAIGTLRVRSTDRLMRSGVALTANLPAPTNISGTYQIQDVTISWAGTSAVVLFDVIASSQRFSFEDLLRQIRGE